MSLNFSLADSAKWIVPERSGSVFPPSAYFSIDILPDNRAIVLGGTTVNDQKKTVCTNDVYTISYTSNSVVSQLLQLS